MSHQVRRPPAIPLVVMDPYTSVWSTSDRLTDDWTRHWTGTRMSLYGVIRVDGTAYRFVGGDAFLAMAAEQTDLTVDATRTIATYRCGPVELVVEFLTPLLLDDLDLMARPVTYVTTTARSLDGRPHEVSVYWDMTGDWAVNVPHERVFWGELQTAHLSARTFRSEHQPVLAKAGDDLRIDWGTAFLAGDKARVTTIVGDIDHARDSFVATGKASPEGLRAAPRKVAYHSEAVIALTYDLSIKPAGTASETVLVAYDDEFSLVLFGEKLRPWWRRNGLDATGLLDLAWAERDQVRARAIAFDDELKVRARAASGEAYASLLSLSWRHTIAAHKLAAAPDGRPVFFSKENFSNGCIATVDVTYPSAPLFLAYNPALLRAMIDPYFTYCASPEWPFDFAAHDLGTYPIANGQTYRGFHLNKSLPIIETQMPVEECGNMLILVGALAQAEGHADYAGEHWNLLTTWADYLVGFGHDPGPQLCTDDFSGVLGHNVNLSAKATMGLACYARLAETLGKGEIARKYRAIAEDFARQLIAGARDGDATRLAYDRPGSWSLKYNMVWDRILGLDIFPKAELAREVAFYATKAELYGVPLDNRGTLTKPEWMLWAASLVEDGTVFDDFVERICRYANETRSRVPLADLYFTDSGRQMGFQARSVLGGFFIRLL